RGAGAGGRRRAAPERRAEGGVPSRAPVAGARHAARTGLLVPVGPRDGVRGLLYLPGLSELARSARLGATGVYSGPAAAGARDRALAAIPGRPLLHRRGRRLPGGIPVDRRCHPRRARAGPRTRAADRRQVAEERGGEVLAAAAGRMQARRAEPHEVVV